MRELPHARQVAGEPRRRWFFCHEMDLVVWFDPGCAPIGFQLAYDKARGERAISWRLGRGYRHDVVDDGEEHAGVNRTPLLAPDGPFPRERVVREFEHVAGMLPSDIAAFVLTRLRAIGSDSARSQDETREPTRSA